MKVRDLFIASLLFVCLLATDALAANTICRAANSTLYAVSIKRAVAAQLTAAGIPFSAVYVSIGFDSRKASIVPFSYDATEQITVSASPLDVVFNEELPTPEACELPGTLYIKVRKGNALILNKKQPITIPGVQASTLRY